MNEEVVKYAADPSVPDPFRCAWMVFDKGTPAERVALSHTERRKLDRAGRLEQHPARVAARRMKGREA